MMCGRGNVRMDVDKRDGKNDELRAGELCLCVKEER